MRCAPLFPALAAVATISPAAAQSVDVDASLEIASDLRERGLSDSGGRATATAAAGLQLGGLRADARVATLRESARHGGADLGITAELSYRVEQGGWTFDAGGAARLFDGAEGKADYGELFATAAYLIGPAELSAAAFYAPDQSAIGGDNLYLRARARASLPGTPWSLTGHVGHSSGATDDPVRAARLRPGGSYTDWSLGAEWTLGTFGAGLTYSDTDIDHARVVSPLADARNSGARLTASARIFF
ncbi:TorF family putative porin [Sphingomonas sp.]|uniref:TorF family putative porin n=1 Tax=Sphingomonas sp. TaxID=28214 RepID=UPI002ED908DE